MIFPYKLIDLTHTLDSDIPTWNGDCGFNHDTHIDYPDCEDEYQFRVMKVKMHAGIGTHMDAPSDCIASSRCIHDFGVNDLIMLCVVIDVSDKCHERYSLSAQDVVDFESKYGLISKDSCVMVKTGWSKFWHSPLKYHNNHVFPSISSEAAELLLERRVSALGIDTLSPDRPEDGFKVHKTFLGSDKIIIENVTNLDSMPPYRRLCYGPSPQNKRWSEAPIRLVGLLKRE